MKSSAKKFLALFMAVVLLISLVACSGNGSSDNNTNNSGATGNNDPISISQGSDAQIGAISAESGTEFVTCEKVTMGVTLLFPTLVPFRNTGGQRFPIVRYLYDRLAYVNDEGKYVPQGAKSWEVADDGVTWTVELYDYITDSEGNHITADDVIWFIEESQARAMKPCFANIASVEKLSDDKLTITMKEDIADAFEIILESTFLISRAAYEASEDGFATKPISASPYVVTDFQPDSSITFTLRDDYWQDSDLEDRSIGHNVKELTLVLIGEASQQQIALETDTIDIMPYINASIVGSFVDNDQYLVCMAPGNNGMQLRFTGWEESIVGRDENLRKAICYCINTDMLIKGAASGYAEPMYDFIPRTSAGYLSKWENEAYFHYDLEKAKEYLAASDYNNEELILAGSPAFQKVYTIIQACCQAIGINVKLDIKDKSIWTVDDNDGRLWDMAAIQTGNGAANIWSQIFDGNLHEYGDQMARNDPELTEMIHYTWKNANYTADNIDQIHTYIFDHAYAYGLYLPYTLSVARSDLNIAETVFNNQGMLDIAACKFAK